jgi:hypothetical protein
MGIENPIQLPSLDVSLQTLKNHFNRNNDIIHQCGQVYHRI